ncbi:hypothetical protein NMG60_11008165 [Bertholletia excelsa]
MIPYFQIKQVLHQNVRCFLTFQASENDIASAHEGIRGADLFHVAKYVELNCSSGVAAAETCSTCLVEFEREDDVSQLPKCGHVFHSGCFQNWLDSDRFNCPLCLATFT